MFQCGIDTVVGQKLLPGTLLHDMLGIHNRDAIGVADCGETMGDHDDGLTLAEAIDALLDSLFRDAVQRRGCLIKDQDRRILQEDTRDGNTLLLSAGEDDAAFSDKALVSVGHVQNVVMDFGKDRSLNDLTVGGGGPAVTDVLHDGTGEEEHVLLDDPDVPAETLLGQRPNVSPVHQHRTRRHIVKPRDQMADGGLAAAGRADQRKGLAGRNGQIDIIENRNAALVGKGHVIETDFTPDIREHFGIRDILDFRLCPHQLDEAVKAGTALGVDLHELNQLADR